MRVGDFTAGFAKLISGSDWRGCRLIVACHDFAGLWMEAYHVLGMKSARARPQKRWKHIELRATSSSNAFEGISLKRDEFTSEHYGA